MSLNIHSLSKYVIEMCINLILVFGAMQEITIFLTFFVLFLVNQKSDLTQMFRTDTQRVDLSIAITFFGIHHLSKVHDTVKVDRRLLHRGAYDSGKRGRY